MAEERKQMRKGWGGVEAELIICVLQRKLRRSGELTLGFLRLKSLLNGGLESRDRDIVCCVLELSRQAHVRLIIITVY